MINKYWVSMSSFNAYLGVALGILFTMMGTAFSTTKAANLLETTVKSYIPIVMSGVLAIYGLIVSLLIVLKISEHQGDKDVTVARTSDALMAAGLVTGFTNLFSGLTMGFISDKANLHSNGINFGVTLALVFAESWGLYGLIISLVIIGKI